MATFRLANKYCDKYCNNTLSLNWTTKTKKTLKEYLQTKSDKVTFESITWWVFGSNKTVSLTQTSLLVCVVCWPLIVHSAADRAGANEPWAASFIICLVTTRVWLTRAGQRSVTAVFLLQSSFYFSPFFLWQHYHGILAWGEWTYSDRCLDLKSYRNTKYSQLTLKVMTISDF